MLASYAKWYSFTPPQRPNFPPPLTPHHALHGSFGYLEFCQQRQPCAVLGELPRFDEGLSAFKVCGDGGLPVMLIALVPRRCLDHVVVCAGRGHFFSYLNPGL